MRRLILALCTAALLAAAGPAAVLADAGEPGSTFPEEPGGNLSSGCAAVATNPGSGEDGEFGDNASTTAIAIAIGLFTDACGGS